MLKQIWEYIIYSPATLVGLGLLLYVNLTSPVKKELKSLNCAYKICFGVFLVGVPFLLSDSKISFCFSQLLSRPLAGPQFIVIGIVLFIFSMLAPLFWRIAGRKDKKINIIHAVFNAAGAIIAFVAILVLNALPLSQIDSGYYGNLLLFETIIFSGCMYVEFNYENNSVLQNEDDPPNKRASVASIFNALWLFAAFSIVLLAGVHMIAALLAHVRSFALTIFGISLDMRVILLILALLFCAMFLFLERGKFKQSLFPLFFAAGIGLCFLIVVLLLTAPEGIFSEYRTWFMSIPCIAFVVLIHKSIPKLGSTEAEKAGKGWTTIATSLVVYCVFAASDVARFYQGPVIK